MHGRFASAFGVGLLLVLALSPPLALANHLGPQNLHGLHLSVLTYVLPQTPWKENATNPPAVPWVRLDGVRTFAGVPQGEGGGPRVETHTVYEAAYQERIFQPAPYALGISGTVNASSLNVEVQVRRLPLAPPGAVDLRIVLFEDASSSTFQTGAVDRFLTRDFPPSVSIDPTMTEQNHTLQVPLANVSETSDVGVVVFVQAGSDSPAEVQAGEVLQAATWRLAQDGPTVQTGKGVLLEFVTADVCPACSAAAQAVQDLANVYGFPANEDPSGAHRYLPSVRAIQWGLGVLGGLGAVLWARPRRPHGDSSPEASP